MPKWEAAPIISSLLLLCLGIINFITSKGCRNWFSPNSPATSLELQRQILDNEIWVEGGHRLFPQASLHRRLMCAPVNADAVYNFSLQTNKQKQKSGSSAARVSP